MNEPIYMDAEYESIRTIMISRGKGGGQLPGKVVHYIPEERADAVIALDKRIETLQRYAPAFMIAATVLISFLAGTCV